MMRSNLIVKFNLLDKDEDVTLQNVEIDENGNPLSQLKMDRKDYFQRKERYEKNKIARRILKLLEKMKEKLNEAKG
jgi:hypothetical protein